VTNEEYQQLVEVLQGQFDPAPIRELVGRIEARLRD